MASTYALPVSPLPHRYHQHSHSSSQGHSPPSQRSQSPSKPLVGASKAANSARVLQNGHLHAHSNPSMPAHLHGPGRSHQRNHSYQLPPTQEDLPPPSYNGDFTNKGRSENSPYGSVYEPSPLYSEFTSVNLDSTEEPHSHDHHDHDHDHDHDHSHGHSHDSDCDSHKPPIPQRSPFTKLFLRYTEGYTLLQSILLEKDSRRIFYFMSLNFAFMMVQAFYGFLTDSLGLLSDSIHMFFDCIALGFGLFAAVASKWPPSRRFPYGFGKIEALSGFGNGVFLMLISIEVIIEAVERLADGHETKRLMELFVVSSLGLAVNLLGMAAFGHHHHGHDHSHGGHDHDHSAEKKHDDHDHDHHDHSHSHSEPALAGATAAKHSHGHGHGHSHDNENMRGIFLHVLADTMGSAAVIVSTVLIHFLGWPGWDPLASCLIAILIFLSSLPLVSSCAKRLLLTVPADVEYSLRETLSGVSDLRGVATYRVPRFWTAEASAGAGDKVHGVMHVIASRGAVLDDVRERTQAFLSNNGMDVVVQVEREGDAQCWCGGDAARSHSGSSRF